MTSSIKRLPVLLCAVLMGFPQCTAWDLNWTVVTLARDGSWGVASSSSQPKAIADAIKACWVMAGPSSDCGAQLMAARGSWVIANLCGDRKVIATGTSLVGAATGGVVSRDQPSTPLRAGSAPLQARGEVDPVGAIARSIEQFSTAP